MHINRQMVIIAVSLIMPVGWDAGQYQWTDGSRCLNGLCAFEMLGPSRTTQHHLPEDLIFRNTSFTL